MCSSVFASASRLSYLVTLGLVTVLPAVAAVSEGQQILPPVRKVATACLDLQRLLPERICFPGDITFDQQQSGYWSQQQREQYPSCRLSPKTASEISTVIQYLGGSNTTFAIKSGGHSSVVGASNLDSQDSYTAYTEGVAIDLSGMRTIQLTGDRTAVWLGTGLRWGDVYHNLERHGLTVAGGRDGDVGVGGYILGGGMSWYANQIGWVCDSVLEFEVVTADGRILRASPAEHADLYWALKGSGSAFGIIAQFKLPTINGTMASAISVEYDEPQVPVLLQTLIEQTEAATVDTHAIGILSFVWQQRYRSYTRSAYIVENIRQQKSTVTERWLGIPNQRAIRDVGNISTLADYMDSKNQRGLRGSKFSLTMKGSAFAMLELYEAFWKTIHDIDFDEDGLFAFVLQPISVPHMQASYGPDKSNIFGLRPQDGPLVLAFVELRWSDSRKDERMEGIMRSLHDDMEAVLIKRDDLHPWVYINYAAGWQNPFFGLEHETYLKLKAVQQYYDPDDTLARLQPGAFRIRL